MTPAWRSPSADSPARFDGAEPDSDTPAVTTVRVGVRYGKVWALRDCSITVPSGSVTALVGPNGAGKTTLLGLLSGLRRPSEGSLCVLGQNVVTGRPSAAQLSGVSVLAQDKPLYDNLTVADMLRFGAVMNPGWDADYAASRVARYRLPPERQVSRLSGGMRTQLALTLALAKRPRLLVLDEPLADLDPLVRKDVLGELMGDVAEHGTSVLMSSHIVGELADVCDHLVLLEDGRVAVTGAIDDLVQHHVVLSGPAELVPSLAAIGDIIDRGDSSSHVSVLLRLRATTEFLDVRWTQHPAALEQIILGYLRGARQSEASDTTTERGTR